MSESTIISLEQDYDGFSIDTPVMARVPGEFDRFATILVPGSDVFGLLLEREALAMPIDRI